MQTFVCCTSLKNFVVQKLQTKMKLVLVFLTILLVFHACVCLGPPNPDGPQFILPITNEHFSVHYVTPEKMTAFLYGNTLRKMAADLNCIVDESGIVYGYMELIMPVEKRYGVYLFCFKDHNGIVPVGQDMIQHNEICESRFIDEYNKPRILQHVVTSVIRNVTFPWNSEVNHTNYIVVFHPHVTPTRIDELITAFNCVLDTTKPIEGNRRNLICFRLSDGRLRKNNAVIQHEDVAWSMYNPPVGFVYD